MTNSTYSQPYLYHDFHIRLSEYKFAESTFKVWIEGETPGGSMRPDEALLSRYPFGLSEGNTISKQTLLLQKLARRRIETQEIYDLGILLADMALPPGKIRSLFDKSLAALKGHEGLRIRLHIDAPALAQLPWEFMALPQTGGEPKPSDFLALRREISLVRTDSVETAAHPLLEKNLFRIVGVLANPIDQPSLSIEEDMLTVREAIATLQKEAGTKLFEETWIEKPATRSLLEQALALGTDIFHFAGHAIYQKEFGYILLEQENRFNEAYRSDKLAQILRNAGVRLVVLAACDTARQDEKTWGLASALSREKIPAVLANQFDIFDSNAILLTQRLYQRLLTGYTIDEAVFEARQAIYQQKGLENRDWGTPVLYLHDKAGLLFSLPKPSDQEKRGPFINVTNAFKNISGKVVDVKIEKVKRGEISIQNTIDTIHENASFSSLEVNELG